MLEELILLWTFGIVPSAALDGQMSLSDNEQLINEYNYALYGDGRNSEPGDGQASKVSKS